MPSPASAAKQAIYVWQGIDARGRRVQGEAGGGSAALVRAQLRRQGLKPLRVRKKAVNLFASAAPRIGPADIALFTRQLATLLKAGVPLVQALDVVAGGLEHAGMKVLAGSLREELAAGNGLAAALGKHPRQFDELYCQLVAAGERSGTLETMLARLAAYREEAEALKAKVRKALHYPLAVLCVALVVSGILLVKVVPQFAETFSSFGAELPLFTRAVLELSGLALRGWPWLLLSAGAALFAWRRAWRRSRRFVEGVERLALRLPLVGGILAKSALARFCRTLATTFAAGVPLVDALDSVAGATGNVVYRQACLRVRDDVSDGVSLHRALRATGLFPAMLLQMVAIGEESGTLDAMLERCAAIHEAEVDEAVDGLGALLEPFIMALLGILVGGLMIAMYLPIFRIGSVI